MAKTWKRLLCAVLASLMAVLLIACGGEQADSSTTAKATEEAKATTEAATTKATEAETTTEAADAFQHDPNLNEPGELGEGKDTICKEQITLTIGVAQAANVEDFETNAQTLWMEKYSNIDLQFVVYPSGEFVSQINLAIVDGGSDLPDIIFANNTSDSVVESWGAAGGVIALNDYYENSAYYLTEALERTGVDFMPMITASDGNIYYVPTYNQSLMNEYGAKLYIYQPWLDTLGLSLPTTPDELYEVLKAICNEDPNGNGLKDEIGLTGVSNDTWTWFEYLMCPFQYVPLSNSTLSELWDVQDGNVILAYTTDGFREGLAYMNKLYSEGLISDAIFTDDKAAVCTKSSAETVIVGAQVGPSMSSITTGTERRIEYTGVAPLYSEDGTTQYAAWKLSTPSCGALISSNCEYPEAAFRLLDYSVSEIMSIWTRWGEPEVDWVTPSAEESGLYEADGYPAVLKDILPWGQLQNKHWYQTGPYIRQYSIALGTVWNGDTTSTSYQISLIQNEYTGKHPDEYIAKLVYSAEESEVVAPIQESINTYLKESIAGFITGSNGMDINDDSSWNAYLKELQNIGSEEALDIIQTVYDRMYK